MTQAVLPDGRILEFPDETDPVVIQGAVKRMLGLPLDITEEIVPQPIDDPGFIERVSQDLAERGDIGEEIQQRFQAGEQGVLESGLQLAGKVGAGGALDIMGEALVSGMEGLRAVTPDYIEDSILDAATRAAFDFMGTDVGRAGLAAVEGGVEMWREFKAENPRAARNIESAANIGLLVAPTKGKPKVPAKPTPVVRAAEVMAGKAATQEAARKASFIDDLVLPKQTAKIRTEQAARTTERGLLGTKEVGLSPGERAMANEVSLVEGVSSKNTIQGNLNVISKEVTAESKKLTDLLKKNDVSIPRREFGAELDRAIVRLGENPLLVGDAAKTATKVVDKMKQIVAKNPGTASGLLKSRKELDAWIKTQKPKVFDPNQESALSLAVREIRQSTNNFIDERAVNVAVKDSLKKQSTLLRATENIAPKAADEGVNSIMRAWQRVSNVIGLRGEFTQMMATAAGVGGLGAAAMFAPLFREMLVLGGVSYVAGRAVLSPTAKRAVSKLLQGIDKSIRISKDEALISQLRMDRAALAELLKGGEK